MSKSRSPKIYEKEVSDQLYLLYIRLFKKKQKTKRGLRNYYFDLTKFHCLIVSTS